MAGEGFSCQRGFIQIGRLGQGAVHRHDFAVPHQQPVTRLNLLQADLMPLPVVEAIGPLGCMAKQRSHLALRTRLGKVFQRAPGREHQRNDRGDQHLARQERKGNRRHRQNIHPGLASHQ